MPEMVVPRARFPTAGQGEQSSENEIGARHLTHTMLLSTEHAIHVLYTIPFGS